MNIGECRHSPVNDVFYQNNSIKSVNDVKKSISLFIADNFVNCCFKFVLHTLILKLNKSITLQFNRTCIIFYSLVTQIFTNNIIKYTLVARRIYNSL